MSLITDPRVVSLAAMLWCIVTVAIYVVCGGTADNTYLSWSVGPHEKLFFIGVAINTWTKWVVLNSLVCIDAAINVWVLEVIHTWVTLNIYDSSKSTLDYSDPVVVGIAVALNIYTIIHLIVGLFLTLTQIDTQMLIIVENAVLTAMIVRLYLRRKKTGEPLLGVVIDHMAG